MEIVSGVPQLARINQKSALSAPTWVSGRQRPEPWRPAAWRSPGPRRWKASSAWRFRSSSSAWRARTAGDEFLVTSIEILSPVNKQRGHDAHTDYLRKRRELLRSATHLIETPVPPPALTEDEAAWVEALLAPLRSA